MTVRVVDPVGCTITSPGKVKFTPDNWNVMRPFRSFLRETKDIPVVCGVGLIHVLQSDDLEYNGLHVRIRLMGLGVEQLSSRPVHTHLVVASDADEDAEDAAAEANDEHETPRAGGDAPIAFTDADFGGPSSEDSDAAADSTIDAALEDAFDADAGEEAEKEKWTLNPTVDLPKMVGRQYLGASAFEKMFGCKIISEPQERFECTLASGTPHETKFYILQSANVPDSSEDILVDETAAQLFDDAARDEDDITAADGDIFDDSIVDDSGIIALVIGGVHGNEPSGSVAATHIQRNWLPKRGTLVVVDRVNVLGLAHSTRYIKGAKNGEIDLNRNFPVDNSEPPRGPLAKHIWTLASILRPNVLFDLHEGWGFYATSKNNPHEKLVGAKI